MYFCKLISIYVLVDLQRLGHENNRNKTAFEYRKHTSAL